MLSQVLARNRTTLLVAVTKNRRSVLFVAQPNGTRLVLTRFGFVAHPGATNLALVRSRERVAFLSSSGLPCLKMAEDCDLPGAEIMAGRDVISCLSTETGVSVAVTGWSRGGIFYIVHAIADPKNKRWNYLWIFRADERKEPSHCTLRAVGSPVTADLCGKVLTGSIILMLTGLLQRWRRWGSFALRRSIFYWLGAINATKVQPILWVPLETLWASSGTRCLVSSYHPQWPSYGTANT